MNNKKELIMKKYILSFFAASALFLGSSIGARSWQGVRNGTLLGVTFNLKGESQQPVLPRDGLVRTSYHGHSGEFRVYTAIRGWTTPDFDALDRQVEAGRRNPENKNKVPVVYIGTSYTGGWDFRIVWEDRARFEENRLM